MTMFKGNSKRGLIPAKRGVFITLSLVAAALCLLGALAGCTSPGVNSTETAEGTASGFSIEKNEDSGSNIDGGTGTLPPSYPTLHCINYNEKDFMASVEAAGADRADAGVDNPGKVKGNTGSTGSASSAGIAGGITPHHLLAAELIAEFFEELSNDPPETIIVIGPNHKRIGFGGLQTSLADWGTPFGRLEADRGKINQLIEDFNASVNDGLMQQEHSVSALVPYIRYYMPGVRIVPILLHGNYSTGDSRKLGKYLGKMAAAHPGKITIIASVDFSHYLDAETAYKMDDITLEAIRKRDIDSIAKMGNDNMDSPPSIITFLGAMEESETAGPEVAGHSNSSDIASGGFDYTTSYFTMFYKYNDK